ncbi:hypothetical protein C0V72_00325 [Porphyrobacter sp. TH134]|uniref:DUF3999 family protein n=1 Tax=Porphyrobacter sp. TH134 TaxID=2067450 RepID=UPI000C7BF90A|nr:DUF3999 family protein [Porphyrobacter sp. TH134]PLK28035.1 hypothetical protein C0V72_00325 [Porphyrobacter sp. TH134]
MLHALVLAMLAQGASVIEGFDDAGAWRAAASDGVEASVSAVPGDQGQALRLDYDFGTGAGYAFASRDLPLDWPENYVLRVKVRGAGGINDLQLKFTDATGENVWWHQRVNFAPGDGWQELRIRPRDMSFAWGPTKDKRLRQTGRMEIVVVRGRDGGAGFVEIDTLTLEPLPPVAPLPAPTLSVPAAMDGKADTAWQATAGDALVMDFGGLRSLSALTLDWQPGRGAPAYSIEGSDDRETWQTLRQVTDGDGGRDPIALIGAEFRYLRIAMPDSAPPAALAEVTLHDADWAPTLNDFIARQAEAAPLGRFPRGFTQQPYWTLVGTDGGTVTGLLGEDGAVEPARGSYTVEPFLSVDGNPFDWANVTTSQSLLDGHLPIATTRWSGPDWALETTAFSETGADPRLLARWRITNTGTVAREFRLTLAVRPFQVNPPAQFLAQRGGVSPIAAIAWDGGTLRITQPGPVADDAPVVRVLKPLVRPDTVGMAGFDHGALLSPERLAPRQQTADPAQFAQAGLTWTVTLAPGQSFDAPVAFAETGPPDFDAAMAEAAAYWRARLGGVALTVPPAKQAVADTLKTALAHVLISREGPALKPGTRSYNRAWIRDGAMMSDTLLRLGVNQPAIDFADWYGEYLFDSGKVPCCVDFRGADPVPENDSHGQYIHLLAQLHRYTGDTDHLARNWDKLDAARRYMESLRQSERTAANQVPGRTMLYGLLPPSISHEGYSEKAQYSLWDDFWGLAGYEAAGYAARILGKPEAKVIAAQGEEFAADILTAIDAAAAHWNIDHIPGATSLGDFDATSTTMALEITGLQPRLKPTLLANTFDRQWRRVMGRPGDSTWKDYTPYELRNVSALVRLGERGRANELLDFYMKDRRPQAWNAWAEVVGRDPREIRFIGDLPHAWVASDFIRAALDLFAYEDKASSSVVLGAGLTEEWLAGDGVTIKGLKTPFGTVDLAINGTPDRLEATVSGSAHPPGGFLIAWPFADQPKRVFVNGRAVRLKDGVLAFSGGDEAVTIVMDR